MKENMKIGFNSRAYEAPHAESVELMLEGSLLLTASDESSLDGGLEDFEDGGTGSWD